MAKRESFTTLYHPETGTAVEVSDDSGRAEVLKDRGYLDKKPRQDRARRPGARSAVAGNDNSQALADKDAEIERLKAELEKATNDKSDTSGSTNPTPPADPKK